MSTSLVRFKRSNIDIDKSLKGGEEFSPPPEGGGAYSGVPQNFVLFPTLGECGEYVLSMQLLPWHNVLRNCRGNIFLRDSKYTPWYTPIMGMLLHLGLHIIVANGHRTQPMAGVARMPNTSACAEYNTHRQRHCPWIPRPSPPYHNLTWLMISPGKSQANGCRGSMNGERDTHGRLGGMTQVQNFSGCHRDFCSAHAVHQFAHVCHQTLTQLA